MIKFLVSVTAAVPLMRTEQMEQAEQVSKKYAHCLDPPCTPEEVTEVPVVEVALA